MVRVTTTKEDADNTTKTTETSYGYETAVIHTLTGTKTYKDLQVQTTKVNGTVTDKTWTDHAGNAVRTLSSGIYTDHVFTEDGKEIAAVTLGSHTDREGKISLTLYNKEGKTTHTIIQPMVEDFFAWAKQQAAECTVPPKSRTGQGLNFVIHQENYLKVFLTDGDIPIDNSASERAIRTFCIGKKNWMFHNTAKGAGASALVYSISETAKLNNLRPYYYFRHILTELPKYCDEKGNIDPAKLDQLMPWAEELPEECRKPRRS